jgi:HPt (histidine-containing phosphotransfer) domain-containing protein
MNAIRKRLGCASATDPYLGELRVRKVSRALPHQGPANRVALLATPPLAVTPMSNPTSPGSSQADASAPYQPCVDVARFRADLREAGIEDMLTMLLTTFLEDSPERLAALDHAVRAANVKAVESAAHAFKSGAGTIRATRLAELLLAVESAAHSGVATSFDQMLTDVQSEYAAVRSDIELVLRNES